ncbi:MAG: isoprenylcysteine carboxylmethyltransferase family protein [Acidobacteria bacterium ACB1]|nr:hypothetical protein [Pyrinomonadaceae bacterium]MCE7962489.1 isoprenylcysteine carboxylmethyltransferase family protein [Acidobacteria bacterium ACB1]RIJ95808.1 MAG: hypothetical protein DCC44_01540 [Acidobacteriota bacterium]
MKVFRTASFYLAFQGSVVIAWWITLMAYPSLRSVFALEPGSETSLLAFWFADLAFLGIGSLVAAYLAWREHEAMQPAMWFVTGAISYATIYTLSFAAMTDQGWLGVLLMLPAMLLSGVFATGLSMRMKMFRASSPSTEARYVLKTFLQIVVVWSVVLVVIPYLLSILEAKAGFPSFTFPLQKPISAALFLGFSSVGIYSAIVMSRIGKGTPLPLDHAIKLVVKGPYAWVRNPMAVSGIGQGLAVALFLGSGVVAVYALVGSAIWQFILRPLEETDLLARFGEPYREYQRAVKCWIPLSTPYRPMPDSGEEAEISTIVK